MQNKVCATAGCDVVQVQLDRKRRATLCLSCEKFLLSPCEFTDAHAKAFCRVILERRAKAAKAALERQAKAAKECRCGCPGIGSEKICSVEAGGEPGVDSCACICHKESAP